MTDRLEAVLRTIRKFPGSPSLHLGVSDEMCDELTAAGGATRTTIHTDMGDTGKPRAIDCVTLHHEGIDVTAQREHRALTPEDL